MRLFAKFLPFCRLPFDCVNCFVFALQKLFSLIQYHLLILLYLFVILALSKKSLLKEYQWASHLCFLLGFLWYEVFCLSVWTIMSQFLQVVWDRCPIYVLGLCFSSFTSIIHQGDYPFSLWYSWLPCWILVDCMYWNLRASLLIQIVKNLPAVQETYVGSLGWEDHLERGMATHSSILAWRIPWTEEPGGL